MREYDNSMKEITCNGIKERERYADISWLMPLINLEIALERIGTKISQSNGEYIRAMCPDHALFVGREPSDPAWVVNVQTGMTYCLTEGRTSNLVFTTCRIHDCSLSTAVQILTGENVDNINFDKLRFDALKLKITRISQEKSNAENVVIGLDNIQDDLDHPHISQKCYDYFIHPPNKINPTNINKETLIRYKVFERTYGYYVDRAIIPFFSLSKLVGFCALDILGEKQWKLRHPLDDGKYKKTLFASGFKSGQYLFGFDDCKKNAEYIILTEGPREVMKLWQEGFTNSVCNFGLHLSPEQFVLISSLNPKAVILMYDSDEKGIAAMDKMSSILSRSFKTHKAILPKGLDPKNLNKQQHQQIINKLLN